MPLDIHRVPPPGAGPAGLVAVRIQLCVRVLYPAKTPRQPPFNGVQKLWFFRLCRNWRRAAMEVRSAAAASVSEHLSSLATFRM